MMAMDEESLALPWLTVWEFTRRAFLSLDAIPLDLRTYEKWNVARNVMLEFLDRLDWLRRQKVWQSRGELTLVPQQLEFPFAIQLDSRQIERLAA
jgi:hypothetical protein